MFSSAVSITTVVLAETAPLTVELTSAGWSQSPDDGINVSLYGNSTSTDSLKRSLKNI